MILTGKGWHWTKRLAGSLASEGNIHSDLRTWNNCTLRCQWRHLRWEPQMTQRDRPWRKGCRITSANLTRKRTRQNSPLEFSLSTSLETQKLLLACLSSRRVEGETILSVTWVRTVKCISCTMEHSAPNCWLTHSSVMRGTLSFHPEFMWPRNDSPQEEKVSLGFLYTPFALGNNMVTSQHSIYKWYMKCSWPLYREYLHGLLGNLCHGAFSSQSCEKPTPMTAPPHPHTHIICLYSKRIYYLWWPLSFIRQLLQDVGLLPWRANYIHVHNEQSYKFHKERSIFLLPPPPPLQ